MPCDSMFGMGSSDPWAQNVADRAQKEADKLTAHKGSSRA